MKHICLYFQVHQPFRLKRYRFFNIGEDRHYFDEYENKLHMQRIARDSYIYTNKILLDLIKEHTDKFKVSFSITGLALEQFELYAPEVLDSFKELAKTGNVEFLAETYSHSLVSMFNKEDFIAQVKEHTDAIKKYFSQTPKVFRNTELIYDNLIGETVAEMGFDAMITEGAKHILGWKSPNVLYYNVINPELKLILKNYELSDDIAFRFSNESWSEYPLTAEKYVSWLADTDKKDEVFNLFMDYETFGEHQKANTGIFDFLKHIPQEVYKQTDFIFSTPSEVSEKLKPVASMNVPYAISWADEERDITAWLGNEMQKEAFNKLYSLSDKIKLIKSPDLHNAWKYLQASDHFYYMSTKILSDGMVHDYFNPYQSPYDAFINYMNVLSDFEERVNEAYENIIPVEPEAILSKIKEYEEKIQNLYNELKKPIMIEKVKPIFAAIERTKEEMLALAEPAQKAKPVAKKKTPAKKTSTAKTSAAKKTPVKKTSSTKKSTAKKAPAKKTNTTKTKKAGSTKTTSKKTTSTTKKKASGTTKKSTGTTNKKSTGNKKSE